MGECICSVTSALNVFPDHSLRPLDGGRSVLFVPSVGVQFCCQPLRAVSDPQVKARRLPPFRRQLHGPQARLHCCPRYHKFSGSRGSLRFDDPLEWLTGLSTALYLGWFYCEGYRSGGPAKIRETWAWVVGGVWACRWSPVPMESGHVAHPAPRCIRVLTSSREALLGLVSGASGLLTRAPWITGPVLHSVSSFSPPDSWQPRVPAGPHPTMLRVHSPGLPR